MMSGASAAPMFWAWDFVEKHGLYSEIGSAARFAKVTQLASRGDLKPVPATTESSDLATLTVSPGLGWEDTTRYDFPLGPNTGPKLEGLSEYIQGKAHPEMMQIDPTFLLDVQKPTEMTFEINLISPSGAQIALTLDDKEIEKRELPLDRNYNDDPMKVQVSLPAGKHRLILSNDGPDWFMLSRITIQDYASRLKARVLASGDYAILWTYNGAEDRGAASGIVRFGGLNPGRYQLIGYETATMTKVETSVETIKKGSDTEITVKPLKKDRVYVLRRL
jgi:hypothetical protein